MNDERDRGRSSHWWQGAIFTDGGPAVVVIGFVANVLLGLLVVLPLTLVRRARRGWRM